MIADGRVTCNGRVCQLGDSADSASDIILIDGKPLPQGGESVYILLNKPRGYVTTLSDEKGRRTVAELVTECGTRVYPVGRLDMDSEGLLVMTNDGDFANRLMHPKHTVEKTYRVWVTGFQKEHLETLRKPIVLDGYRIQPPKVMLKWQKEDTAQLTITIHEGRNRQIRRMCEHAHMKVTRLQRIREGALELGQLPLGKWRYLSREEVSALLSPAQETGKVKVNL